METQKITLSGADIRTALWRARSLGDKIAVVDPSGCSEIWADEVAHDTYAPPSWPAYAYSAVKEAQEQGFDVLVLNRLDRMVCDDNGPFAGVSGSGKLSLRLQARVAQAVLKARIPVVVAAPGAEFEAREFKGADLFPLLT